jgi:hypothetical protein
VCNKLSVLSTILLTIFQMTKRTIAVLASMMLVASLAVAGCASASEEVTVDDIIVEEVTEEVTTDESTEEVAEPVVMEEVSEETAE